MLEEILARLKDLAAQFTDSDTTGLRLRWQFGRKVLEHRGGKKKLPNGELDRIAEETGVERRDIQHFMRFAEFYPTEVDCDRAVHNHPSWTQLKTHGLKDPNDPKPKTYAPQPTQRRADRLLDQLTALDFLALTDAVDYGERLIALGRNAIALAKQHKAA